MAIALYDGYVFISGGDTPLIWTQGSTDSLVAEAAFAAAAKLLQAHSALKVDCARGKFTNPIGLSMLSSVIDLSQAQGKTVYLLAPSTRLLQGLSSAGMDRKFEVDMTVDEREWNECHFFISAALLSARDIRDRVCQLAREMPFSEEDTADIRLAVGEAASNAVKYGSPEGERSLVRVVCTRRHDAFTVQITDQGEGFDLDSKSCKSACSLEERGRGILFMRMLMDEVRFSFDLGTTVSLTKKLCIR